MSRPFSRMKLGYYPLPIKEAQNIRTLLVPSATYAAIELERGQNLVVACSALKQRYRETLADGVSITWVYLKGSEEVIRARLLERQHHFFKAQMLASQFADVEEPTDAVIIDVEVAPSVAVRQILHALFPARAKAS